MPITRRTLLSLLAAPALLPAAEDPFRDWNLALSKQQGRDLYWLDDADQRREPFQLFDDVYYVGIQQVGAHLIDTGEGLILIDTTFANLAYQVLENIRKLGFDPHDIKYIFVTHAHIDHAGGIKPLAESSGAKVAMSAADWEMMARSESDKSFRFPSFPRDIVIDDGDEIALGKTKIHFRVTPGHTPGVLTLEYDVHDNGQPYKAITFGGPGVNFQGVRNGEQNLATIQRLMAIKGVQVNVPPHPFINDEFAKAEKMKSIKPGEPNPFVAPEEFQEWLRSLQERGKAKIEKERAAGRA